MHLGICYFLHWKSEIEKQDHITSQTLPEPNLANRTSLFTGVLKEEEPADTATDLPSSDSRGKEQRYSSAQFFFEYLVVVSLKKTKEGAYEPQITYQFPKVSIVLDQWLVKSCCVPAMKDLIMLFGAVC